MGGAAVGIGAHLVATGVHWLLRPGLRGPVVGVACASGLLGALVAGRLARRRARVPALALVSTSPPAAVCAPREEAEAPPRPSVERVLRRGPSGREQPWFETTAPA
ncbi:hypothetical protein A176_000220 [Myxococcus hansupus]|uniref:Uncharacterized protein n=1 Tax=Pseudomyxococcus hansupus TaxID=1297742 RepID=A0A0H4WP04_9BACT|nr:hypothetical protein A176_000220 [Myxococcus hansupus]